MSSRIKNDEVNGTAQECKEVSLPCDKFVMDLDGKKDVVELNDESFSKLTQNLGSASNWLGCKINEMAQSGRIDSRSGEIMQYALGASFNGERCLISMLIDENHATRILDMDANALHPCIPAGGYRG